MKTAVMEQLLMQLRFAPPSQRHKQITAAEKLLNMVRPDTEYPFEFICFHITGFRPKGAIAHEMLPGDELIGELLVLIKKLSGQVPQTVDNAIEKVYTLAEAAEFFDVVPRTIERWQRRGLGGRQFIFDDGRPRLGFSHSSLAQFEAAHPGLINRARKFAQMLPRQRQLAIARAKELARSGYSRKDAITAIAAETGKTAEAIRYHLARQEAAGEKIFSEGGVISPDEMHQIHHLHRQGTTVADLMGRFARSRSSIYRIINAATARELLGVHMQYIDSEEFVADGAARDILGGELPQAVAQENTLASDLEQGKISLHDYLTALQSCPSISAVVERTLFRRYNYVKYRFNLVKVKLDVARPAAAQVKELQRLLAHARALGKYLRQSYLRLVVSVAQKHQLGPERLLEYVLVGNRALTKALDAYDYRSGTRFSSFANLAIAKEFARLGTVAPTAMHRAAEAADQASLAIDTSGILEMEKKDRNLANVIRQNLDECEQKIIMSRYRIEYTVIPKQPRSLKELGEELELTTDQVRRLELAAIGKLRHLLSDEELKRLIGEFA